MIIIRMFINMDSLIVVLVFKNKGVRLIAEQPGGISDLTVDTEGNVIFADVTNNQVFRITNESIFAPQLDFPSTVDVGDVVVGAKKMQSLELTNKGNMGLGILRISSQEPGLSVQPMSADIKSGGSSKFEVTVDPVTAGDIKAEITVLSTDPDRANASISLKATAFAASISLDLEQGAENKGVQVLTGVAAGDSVSVQLFCADTPSLVGYQVSLEFDPATIVSESFAYESGTLLPNALAVKDYAGGTISVGAAATGSSFSESTEGFMGTLRFVVAEAFGQSDSTSVNITNAKFSLRDGSIQEAPRHGRATLSAEKALVGDFDNDSSVGFADFIQFAQAFGIQSTEIGYDSRFDLDSDGVVGFSDFLLFAAAFGSTG